MFARNKEFSLNDLFYFFKKYPGQSDYSNLCAGIYQCADMLPYTIYEYSLPTDISDMNLMMGDGCEKWGADDYRNCCL